MWAQEETDPTAIDEGKISAFKFRNVGPAFTSGRIADLAIHPDDDNVWYVAVGSGGVWKTTNAGTTWEPIFDKYDSYSTGCITLDPQNPNIVWLGTGENVGGRHVGYGDGIYRSTDGGESWTNMGLEKSEHISKIIVHPENSDIVWVAAQGPLWNQGGERGFYMTTDGGTTWTRTLGDEEWTGVTDIAVDPRNPDRLYAATWQRHRTVAAYMGGGPESGLHRSEDGGKTWTKLETGLPSGNMGKIGLAISPQQPDVLYAAIELNRTKGGVWRSTDRGASWEKQSDAVSGGTGPHYYQELYACPHQFDRIYLMDVRIQVSDDGGKNFRRLNESNKHSDNHAMAFRADDPDYLLIGSDGGLYESFDLAKTWRYFDNLPVTQYYKVAVDDRKPFYHIFGGTQDNGSHGGPHRTDNGVGITNGDWYKTLGADGHQSATEPGNPNIGYAEGQQGWLHRLDRITGEAVSIQPQARPGEDPERFNWDAPILVSPHEPSRIYFASQRVWRSDNRGDSWTPVSSDLTRDEERITQPIMGKQQSWDSPWDMNAMSNFNTITSLSESPLEKGLLYVGTDDGIIQVTEDGGENWRKIEVSKLPDCPGRAFVNDIKADLFDANTVYVCLDNHKEGDFKPYVYKSTNRGKSWKSIAGNLPDRHLVWRLVQDHEQPNLMFLATEFGIFCTLDGGEKWIKMKSGIPTISFRDLVIQRGQNDLVGASFGRGFFVLDDYAPLREMTEEVMDKDAALFTVRPAPWYNPRILVGSQGSNRYVAPNPEFGALFTYYLQEGPKTAKELRKEKEKELAKEGKDIPFPGWEALDEEEQEPEPKIWLTVRDAEGHMVNRITSPTSAGVHRVNWKLDYAPTSPIKLEGEDRGRSVGMAVPGEYTVELAIQRGGKIKALAGPVPFQVERLRKGALPGASPEKILAFRAAFNALQTDIAALDYTMEQSRNKIEAMEKALVRTSTQGMPAMMEKLHSLREEMEAIDLAMNGPDSKDEIGEPNVKSMRSYLWTAASGLRTTYGPTGLQQECLKAAQTLFEQHKDDILNIAQVRLPEMEKALREAGAPWIEGQPLPIGSQE